MESFKTWNIIDAFAESAERLKTFKDWKGAVEATQLAQSGFVCTKRGNNSTTCVYCHTQKANWQTEDVPDQAHPNCPGAPIKAKINLEDATTCIMGEFRYPNKYLTQRSRLKTFPFWFKKQVPSKKTLAKEGFVYTGLGDLVFCFFCKLGLYNLDEGDDLRLLHAKHSEKHSEKCRFLQLLNKYDDDLNNKKKTELATDVTVEKMKEGLKLESVYSRLLLEKCGIPYSVIFKVVQNRHSSTGLPFQSLTEMYEECLLLDMSNK